MKNIVVLGGGTGGAIVSNMLRHRLSTKEWSVTVIDSSDRHLYQPGLLFIPFGLYDYKDMDSISRPIGEPISANIDFVNAEVLAIDPEKKRVETSSGTFPYDWLVSSLGCRIAPEEVDGLKESFGRDVHTFYTPEGAVKLRSALNAMREGRLVIDIADMPIKCPVAPIEFAFLADYFFNVQGLRKRVSIDLVTPLSGAFTKPVASAALGEIARRKNINIVPNFALESVDGEAKKIRSFDGISVEYDLLVSIPPNLGPRVLDDSGLGDGTGFGLTDRKTLKSRMADYIYFVGDNANVPTSKAGSVAHFQAETAVDNILREIQGKNAVPAYDGHANCFIESGFHKALLIDFNYDVEPLQGVFPMPHMGPFNLLEESIVNHLGKLAFKWVYWHMLLGGHLSKVPLLPSHMSFFGKELDKLPEISRSRATKIGEVMTADVITVPLGTSLPEAARLITDHHITGLPVVDPDGRLAGIITEADFVSVLDADEASVAEEIFHMFTKRPYADKRAGCVVEDVMTREPVTLRENDTIHQAVEAMSRHHIGRIVVTDEADRVMGILAGADLIRLFCH